MNLQQRLAGGDILLLDGAMGSLLTERGADGSEGHVNLRYPEIVQGIHRDYIAAGADCIITNTFILNEVYAAKQGQLAGLDDAVRAGVENALVAADGQAYVLGDMGPSGDLLAPFGPGDPAKLLHAYQRLAATLAELPIDAIIIETVFHLPEAELMMQACHEAAPNLPFILSMTFSSTKMGGRTIMGDKADVIAATARQMGALAVGSNCGDLTPWEQAEVMTAMAEAGLPRFLQPNAGKPRLEKGQVIYDLGPEQFAEGMLACKDAGAQVLGGCCGTTPAHIAALAQALRG